MKLSESKKLRGLWGEQQAAAYLKRCGYRIVGQNYTCRFGEIDVIAADRKYVVFVEVKLRKSGRGGVGREAVTPAKQRRISQGALAFMARRGLMNRQARFDVIEIQGTDVTHIVNAFPYQGPAF